MARTTPPARQHQRPGTATDPAPGTDTDPAPGTDTDPAPDKGADADAAPTRGAHPAPGTASGPAPSGDAVRLPVRLIRHNLAHAVAICLLTTASAAATVALPATLGHTLDLVLGGREAGFWIALCAALIAADVVCDAFTALLTGTTNARAAAWLRGRALSHLLAVGPGGAARFTPGDLVTRMTGNATEAGTGPATAAAGLAALLAPLGGLVALALTDVRLAAVFLAGVPVLVVLLRAFARSSSDSVGHYQRVQGDIAARLVEALGGARTIAAAGTERRERDRILAPLPELGVQGRRMWQVYGRAVVQGAILVPLLQTAVFAGGGILLAGGDITVGGLLAATRYAGLAAGLGGVTGPLNALVRSRAAARRTAELLAVPAVSHGHRPLPPEGTGRLELRGVTVLKGGTAVLRGVDLVVPGGSTTAVVGRSGAGKSVLAALAGRLADPDEGEVLLDGVPLPDADPDTLRREVGYAFERPALFGRTVADTLAYGPYEPTPAEIRAAARAAGADAFIRRLPDGYATPLERAPLSGGELQRLGLARAFAHAGRLLVLDDATSSLDSVTELEVGRALAREVRPGTRLVVAHRASSAARADLVAWLEEGRIRAVAPHETLWELADYRRVFAADDTGPGAAADEPARGEGA
ncbi:ATP-binding cassette domain-containing protein [Streptomyces sp. NPDC048639]|uniref:ATP-binding cassette domain-containing protein n=1 Tax=Streptomyces sp. NPDC048639 TaxID=3365581 RepID=UPI003717E750